MMKLICVNGCTMMPAVHKQDWTSILPPLQHHSHFPPSEFGFAFSSAVEAVAFLEATADQAFKMASQ